MSIDPDHIDSNKIKPDLDGYGEPLNQDQSDGIPVRRVESDYRIYDLHKRWNFDESSNLEIPLHWSVPWSDLMMVMMVMFAVMFVTKMAERDVKELFKEDSHLVSESPPQHELPKVEEKSSSSVPIEEILRLSEKLVTDANLDNIDVVLTDNQTVKVSVRGNLLFDSGSAELKSDAVSFLDKLAGVIASNHYQIEVTGHTDNFPISSAAYPTNWELSSARAARVARYLIQAGNLEPGRFTISGHAFYRPVVPNDSLTDKARNRRVEILITRNEYKS